MKSTRHMLARPLLLFLVTGVGLIAALVSDGIGDIAGWVSLAYVVSVALRCSFAKKF